MTVFKANLRTEATGEQNFRELEAVFRLLQSGDILELPDGEFAVTPPLRHRIASWLRWPWWSRP